MLSRTETFRLSPSCIYWGVQACFAVIYLILTVWVLISNVDGSGFTNDNRRPEHVQRRPLLHATSYTLAGIMPEHIQKRVTSNLIAFREGPVGQAIIHIRHADGNYKTNEHLYMLSDETILATSVKILLIYIAECLFVLVLFKMAELLFPDSPGIALLSPMLALCIVLACAAKHSYTYDIPELLFATALLYVLRLERFWLYLILFGLATLNKESTIFCIVFFAIWFFTRMPQRQYVLLLIAQVAIFVVIKVAVSAYFGHKAELLYWQNWRMMLLTLYNYDFPNVVAILLVLFLGTYRWFDKPEFLRYSLWLVPPNIAAYLYIGWPDEYRAFYWCVPTASLLITHSLVGLAGIGNVAYFRKTPPR